MVPISNHEDSSSIRGEGGEGGEGEGGRRGGEGEGGRGAKGGGGEGGRALTFLSSYKIAARQITWIILMKWSDNRVTVPMSCPLS